MNCKRFHIEDGRLVKTSNGQPIPDDEPLFILRGRDVLGFETLCRYMELAEGNDVGGEFLEELRLLAVEFRHYAIEHGKIPNVTRGR